MTVGDKDKGSGDGTQVDCGGDMDKGAREFRVRLDGIVGAMQMLLDSVVERALPG